MNDIVVTLPCGCAIARATHNNDLITRRWMDAYIRQGFRLEIVASDRSLFMFLNLQLEKCKHPGICAECFVEKGKFILATHRCINAWFCSKCAKHYEAIGFTLEQALPYKEVALLKKE